MLVLCYSSQWSPFCQAGCYPQVSAQGHRSSKLREVWGACAPSSQENEKTEVSWLTQASHELLPSPWPPAPLLPLTKLWHLYRNMPWPSCSQGIPVLGLSKFYHPSKTSLCEVCADPCSPQHSPLCISLAMSLNQLHSEAVYWGR